MKLHQNTLSLVKLAKPIEANDSTTTESIRGVQVGVKGLSEDKELQYSIIHLEKQLEAGEEYALGVDFVGNLNDDLAGFYKIKYERQNSNEVT